METHSRPSFHIGEAIEYGAWMPFQKGVLLLIVLSIVLDGLNNQILGFAIPAMSKSWHLTSSAFAPLVGATLVAMIIGTLVGGVAGDRFGRRPGLIVSVVLFGLGTLACASARSLSTLLIFRVFSAVGLGGAMPNGTVLLAEYTPAVRRGLAVSLGILGIPLGGMIGGGIAAIALAQFGWRTLFLIGGIIPLCVGVVMVLWLPEAPRYLLAKPAARPRLLAVLRKCGFDLAADTPLVLGADARGRMARFAILRRGLLGDTLFLWSAYFFCLMSVYVMFNWLPALLSTIGYDLSGSSSGLAGFNLGGIAGAVLGGLAIDRFGSKVSMASGAACGALMAAAMAVGLLPLAHGVIQGVMLLSLLGVFIQGVQITLFALAVQVYPESMRATGVGAALGLGRLGGVASALAGVVLKGGVIIFFSVIAVAMICATGSLLAIKRHKASARALRFQGQHGVRR